MEGDGGCGWLSIQYVCNCFISRYSACVSFHLIPDSLKKERVCVQVDFLSNSGPCVHPVEVHHQAANGRNIRDMIDKNLMPMVMYEQLVNSCSSEAAAFGYYQV